MLKFVKDFLQDYDYAPSYREIADGMGLSSPATVHQHLQVLKSKGYLDIDADAPRGIALTSKVMRSTNAIELPLVGLITAGAPIEAIEEMETMAVPANLVSDENAFVLKVSGESMIDEGIFDGDYVVVERDHSPKNGDVVVALLNNAYATLEKFYRETNRIRLQPANSTMKPIYCRDVVIQGIVRAIIRKFS